MANKQGKFYSGITLLVPSQGKFYSGITLLVPSQGKFYSGITLLVPLFYCYLLICRSVILYPARYLYFVLVKLVDA